MSFQAITPNSEAAILARLIQTQDRNLVPEAAEYLLSFAFEPHDLERMNQLARRSQTGTLKGKEREELESYLHVSNLLAVMQSKARQFLKAHESHVSLQRLRRNQPLTPSDLTELERMLVAAGGTQELIAEASSQSHGLGIFIRSLVGLDRETATQAFSEFVTGTTATPNQIEFIDLIVQYLTENGVMDAARLYESPFTDISQQGPEAVFPSAKVEAIVRVLEEIRQRAA